MHLSPAGLELLTAGGHPVSPNIPRTQLGSGTQQYSSALAEWCLQSPQSHISRDLIRWVLLSPFHLLENWGSEKGGSVPEGPKANLGQVSCSSLLELTHWPHELRSCPAHPSSLYSLKSRTLGGSSDFPTVLPAPNSKTYILS